MKRVLVGLTYLTAGVVVVVLAYYLSRTAVPLIRANRNLAEAADNLRAVRDNTASLSQDLPAVNDAAAALRNRLAAVEERLRGIVPVATR